MSFSSLSSVVQNGFWRFYVRPYSVIGGLLLPFVIVYLSAMVLLHLKQTN